MFKEIVTVAAAAHRHAFEEFIAQNRSVISETGLLLGQTLQARHKILLCGNGGSAADAQHMAGEIVGRFLTERPAFPAIALTTDTSVLTAVGNDYGFEQVFARQVEGLGAAGDALVAISTSGNSANVLRAIEAARRIGMTVIGLTGRDGGKMKSLCDHCIVVPNSATPRIQEMHVFTIHTWCAIIDDVLGEGPATP